MIRLTNFKLTFADHAAQEALLRQSDLEWTLARPVALNDQEQTQGAGRQLPDHARALQDEPPAAG